MTMTTTEFLIGRHYIDGTWRTGSGSRMESRSPARQSELVGIFPRAGQAEVSAAVAAAGAAFPGWRRAGRPARAALFATLARSLARDAPVFAELIARESGKVISECRAELTEGLTLLRYLSESARDDVAAAESPAAEPGTRTSHQPRGVAAVITSWDVPLAGPLWFLGRALLYGNTTVLKPSEDTPAVAHRLVELFGSAGFPAGVVNMIHGDGSVGELLMHDPGVHAVLFSGSPAARREARKVSAEHPDRPFEADPGGGGALIICADARLEMAVPAALTSAFKSTGQRPESARRILIHESLFDRFAGEFLKLTKKLRIGDPLDPATFTGPLIRPEAVAAVERHVARAKAEGAQTLLDGGRITDHSCRDGCYLSPFILTVDRRPGVRFLREEVTGPHVALVPFGADEEAVETYADTGHGLSLAVITDDASKARRFRDECRYGLGCVNGPTTRGEVRLPLGQPSPLGLTGALTSRAEWAEKTPSTTGANG